MDDIVDDIEIPTPSDPSQLLEFQLDIDDEASAPEQEVSLYGGENLLGQKFWSFLKDDDLIHTDSVPEPQSSGNSVQPPGDLLTGSPRPWERQLHRDAVVAELRSVVVTRESLHLPLSRSSRGKSETKTVPTAEPKALEPLEPLEPRIVKGSPSWYLRRRFPPPSKEQQDTLNKLERITNMNSRIINNLSPVGDQREQTDQLHNQDVTHIIAAEAEFAKLLPDSQVDTLIWLQIPPSSSATLKMTCTGTAYPTNWLLCYSSTILRESGFAKFAQMLDDERYQKRKSSKLLLSGQLGPNAAEIMKKIRYVLDLGPSTDFDLRSEHLEALTLPKGIVQYSMMTRLEQLRRAPISAAGGHDDACHCFNLKLRGAKPNEPGYWVNGKLRPLTSHGGSSSSSTSPVSPSSPTTQNTAGIDIVLTSDTSNVGTDGAPVEVGSPQEPEVTYAPVDPAASMEYLHGSVWDLPLAPEFRIDDYCEIRHIANVIRLLLAMAGKPLHLNSAARVYTIAGLAKLFRLESSDAYHIGTSASGAQVHQDLLTGRVFANSLRSIIADWFFRLNNANIIDVLPEECLTIAWNVKLPVVARVSYRILVAERALQEAGNTAAQPRKYQSRQKSVFGRELSGLLDEDMETMIDHSSEAMVQRILKTRDEVIAEINARKADSFIAGLTGNNSRPAVSEFGSLAGLSNIRTGSIHNLLMVAQTLAEYADHEQLLAKTNQNDIMFALPHEYPVANALDAVRRLLDALNALVLSSLPDGMPDSTLLLSTYTEGVQKSLSYYVRESVLHKNWFVHVYNDLPDDKKCMTSVYWRLLSRSIEDKIATAFHGGSIGELVDAVNKAISTALIYNVPIGTAEGRGMFRRQLIERLEPNIGYDAATPPLYTPSAFMVSDLRYALYSHAAEIYKKMYERMFFVPEFELAMLDPSPHLLLGLSADEFRFLPLWAGGDNDGTGAVFEPALPTAHLGPITPGPEYHTGTTNTSMSTPSIDDAFSMAGPPSISDAGNTERLRGMALSDAGTARGPNGEDDDDGHSVSSSFIMVRDFNGLNMAASQAAGTPTYSLASSSSVNSSLPSNVSRAVQDGHSTLTGASLATPSSSSAASSAFSAPSVALTSSSHEGDLVVVGPRSTAPTTGIDDVEFEFEDDDGIYNYEDDDDVEDQEYYDDDDDDAKSDKSDDTVMPDREEVEQAMLQDVQMQAGSK